MFDTFQGIFGIVFGYWDFWYFWMGWIFEWNFEIFSRDFWGYLGLFWLLGFFGRDLEGFLRICEWFFLDIWDLWYIWMEWIYWRIFNEISRHFVGFSRDFFGILRIFHTFGWIFWGIFGIFGIFWEGFERNLVTFGEIFDWFLGIFGMVMNFWDFWGFLRHLDGSWRIVSEIMIDLARFSTDC